MRRRDEEERLTKYYSEECIAVLAEINKRERARAKRDLFALVVVVRFVATAENLGLSKKRAGYFAVLT